MQEQHKCDCGACVARPDVISQSIVCTNSGFIFQHHKFLRKIIKDHYSKLCINYGLDNYLGINDGR